MTRLPIDARAALSGRRFVGSRWHAAPSTRRWEARPLLLARVLLARASLPAALGFAAALASSCGGRLVSGNDLDSGAAGPAASPTPSPASQPRADGGAGPSPAPRAELCNRLDDDGDGQVDENCPCDPSVDGGQQDCYTGAAATRGVGICRAGHQQCVGDQEFRFWGACFDEITPQAEVPGDRLDNDCDGETDENTPPPPPTCTNGANNYPACTTNSAGACINGTDNPPACTARPTCANGGINHPVCTVNAAGNCLNGMTDPPSCVTAPRPACARGEDNDCYHAATALAGMTLVDNECYATAYGASTRLGYCDDFTYGYYHNALRALPLGRTVGCRGAGSAYTVSTAPSATVIGSITQTTCWADHCVNDYPLCLRRFRP